MQILLIIIDFMIVVVVFSTSLNTRATVSVSRSSLLRNHLIFAARAELRDGADGEGNELNREETGGEEAKEREREWHARSRLRERASRRVVNRRGDRNGVRGRDGKRARAQRTTQDAARARSTGWASTRRLRASSLYLDRARASSVGPRGRIAPRPHRSRTRERFLGGIRLPAGRPSIRYFSSFHRGPYNLLVSCRPRIMPLILLVFHSVSTAGPSPTLCFFSPSFSHSPSA